MTPAGADEREIAIAAAAETAQDASVRFESLVQSGAANPIDALVAELAAAGDDVELSEDGATVIVSGGTGFPIGVLTDSKDRPEWSPSALGTTGSALESGADGGIVCQETTHPRTKTACIVSAFQSEFGQSLDKVDVAMKRAGYQTKVIRLQQAKDVIALRESLAGCGVLYLSSHGAVSKSFDGVSGNVIATEIPLAGDAKAPGLHADLAEFVENFGGNTTGWLGAVAHKGKAYWALTPEFFASVSYPNTLVYADACHSGRSVAGGQSLRERFRANGAGAFLGWDGAISTRFSNPAADALFEGLAGRPVTIDAITLVTSPADPEAGVSYSPSADISPPSPDVPLTLTVSGTDGFSMTDPKATDAAGHASFAVVPGGAGGVVDTLTVVAGGARNTTAVASVVSSTALQTVWTLPYNPKTETKSALVTDAADGFNLICANETLAKTTTIVKF